MLGSNHCAFVVWVRGPADNGRDGLTRCSDAVVRGLEACGGARVVGWKDDQSR